MVASSSGELAPLRVERQERALRPRQQRLRARVRGRQPLGQQALARLAAGREEARCARRRCGPPAPRRSTAAMRSAALTSLAEPDARTSRSRRSSASDSSATSCSSMSAMRTSGAEPDRLAVDLLRLDEAVIAVVVEAHGRGEPVLLAQRSGAAADRNCRRWHRPRPSRAPRRAAYPAPRVASASISSAASASSWFALVLVEDGEARRHAGLQRKALQQPLAEGVDGLHLEAARRLDGDGEQLPRPLRSPALSAPGRAARRACLELARRASSPTRPAARTRASTSRPPRPWCRSAPGCARAACRRAAGAARAWSARASCRCRRWR